MPGRLKRYRRIAGRSDKGLPPSIKKLNKKMRLRGVKAGQPLHTLFYLLLFCLILQGVKTFLSGTDLNDLFHVVNEDLSIADVAGVQNLLCRFNDQVNRNL